MDDAPRPPESARASIRVLASGSSGNCTVLVHHTDGRRRVALIDAGLSPRRTRTLLAQCGLCLDDVTHILLTHLDTDHWHVGWPRALARDITVRLHRRHCRAAERTGALGRNNDPFEHDFELWPGLRARPLLLSHDELGVCAYRFEFADDDAPATLGFATDVGHVTDELIDHVAGVNVLAIESNYCPVMQRQSGRPWFLQQRIMGGAGHLSNEQCAAAVRAAEPVEHVVLLHLSRQCNTPERVFEHHAGADYTLTIAEQCNPTRWITVQRQPSNALAR